MNLEYLLVSYSNLQFIAHAHASFCMNHKHMHAYDTQARIISNMHMHAYDGTIEYEIISEIYLGKFIDEVLILELNL